MIRKAIPFLVVLLFLVIPLVSYSSEYTCPYGFTLSSDNSTCYTQPQCPTGSSYNSATNRCEEQPSSGDTPCSPGWNYDRENSVCYIQANCPDNSTLQNGQCVTQPTVIDGGQPDNGTAISGWWCSNDSNDPSDAKQCYDIDGGDHLCPIDMERCLATYGDPTCPSGGTVDPTLHKCVSQTGPACPSGYTASGDKCVANPTCPGGSTYNPSTDRCEMAASESGGGGGTSCTTRAWYNNFFGKTFYFNFCIELSNGKIRVNVRDTSFGDYNYHYGSWVDISGGSGSSCVSLNGDYYCVDTSNDNIRVRFTSWDSSIGSTRSFTSNWQPIYSDGSTCGGNSTSYIICLDISNGGIRARLHSYDSGWSYGQWVPILGYTCPSGWTLSGSTCYQAASCPSGGSLDGSTDKCEANYICPSGYTYNSTDNLCEASPQCDNGTFDSDNNQCYEGDNTCPSGDYSCLPYNGANYCSPHSCVDLGDPGNSETTQADLSSYTNDGQRDDNGNCLGTVYIFNGKPYECRTAGLQTMFTNCCSEAYKKQGKVLMILPQCNKEDAKTDQFVQSGVCHYVGKYCSWHVKLLGCLQHKKVYCCFHSKLGRIIQEQGRPQLASFGYSGDWGDPESPNCRGFTPEEFQMLDFNKIDLSEYFGDVAKKVAGKQGEIQQKAQDNIQNFYNNTR
ncbi:conjugal transfer protein TraN [Hippea maritima]|uniref:Uncharacterized protein n=1 Tax=Hippea maritima (strain ATCC 700847 / DSM 10411 / MH2) TaxID=760142 RepID=F2LV17_HIPMA|nr:conjugal transfer protein TraN [Hippea maritima]AEA33601.1 hypothetical protein Hipma_0631 [Hippea maritima DSM 10411]